MCFVIRIFDETSWLSTAYLSLCHDGIRGWNHSLSCGLCSLSEAAFVHVRPAQLCTENAISIYMCSAVEVAWLAYNFRHSSTRV